MPATRPNLTSSQMVAALAGCGLAAADMRRRRRRRRADRAIHELRRPLQALLLAPTPASRGQLTAVDLALAALRDLELVLEGRHLISPLPPATACNWTRLLADAGDRWQQAAWLRGGRITHRCLIDDPSPLPEDVVIYLAQALDNLILNALTHGGAAVEVTASPQACGYELRVVDRGVPPASLPSGRHRRSGQGLKVVAEISGRLGGAFELDRNAGGCVAVIKLPRLGRID